MVTVETSFMDACLMFECMPALRMNVLKFSDTEAIARIKCRKAEETSNVSLSEDDAVVCRKRCAPERYIDEDDDLPPKRRILNSG